MCGSMVDIQSPPAENRRGKKKEERRKKEETTAAKYNGLPYWAVIIYYITRMWANAQRDGRPAEYRWRPLFNAAKFG